MDEQTRSQIIEIVARVAEVEPGSVPLDATFADLDIDSLRGLRIVAEMEKRFKVVISEADIGTIRSIPDVFALVARMQAGGQKE